MDNKKSNTDALEVGNILSETQYYTVTGKDHDKIHVKNERDFEFSIANAIVEEGMYSANQYDPLNVQKVSRSELINILANVGDTVFTAKYNKQPKAEDINNALESINKGRIISNKEIAKVVKDAFDGTERVIVGKLLSVETGFGRSQVIDLEIPYDKNRVRQIDHRTLSEIIFKGIKYIAKK